MTRVFNPPLIGNFRKRISIEAPAVNVSTDGSTVNAWAKVADAWASIEPIGGAESYVDGVKIQTPTNQFQIRMLYQPGINTLMRATYQGRRFNFTSVNDVGELHRDLDIKATELTV